MVPGSYIGENSLESITSAIKSLFVGKARTLPTPWDISAERVRSRLESKLCQTKCSCRVRSAEWEGNVCLVYIAGRTLLNQMKIEPELLLSGGRRQ